MQSLDPHGRAIQTWGLCRRRRNPTDQGELLERPGRGFVSRSGLPFVLAPQACVLRPTWVSAKGPTEPSLSLWLSDGVWAMKHLLTS